MKYLYLFLLSLNLISCIATKYSGTAINIPIIYKGKEMYQNIKTHPFVVKGVTEKVKKGFVYDGASVPTIAWSFMPPDGIQREGALIHDWCYVHQGHLKNINITKDESDMLLHDYLILNGVSNFRAWIVYKAVSNFGSSAWNSKDEIIILPVCLTSSQQCR